jgi:hypothetical protein
VNFYIILDKFIAPGGMASLLSVAMSWTAVEPGQVLRHAHAKMREHATHFLEDIVYSSKWKGKFNASVKI